MCGWWLWEETWDEKLADHLAEYRPKCVSNTSADDDVIKKIYAEIDSKEKNNDSKSST